MTAAGKTDDGHRQTYVAEGIAPSFDSLAVKVVREILRWQPEKRDGTPIRMGQSVKIPIISTAASNSTSAGTCFSGLKISTDDVLAIAEQRPMFPGGPVALMRYLRENLTYPSEAKSSNIQGRAHRLPGSGIVQTIIIGNYSLHSTPSTKRSPKQHIHGLLLWAPVINIESHRQALTGIYRGTSNFITVQPTI